MKLLKRALPLLLAFAMLFALAACGQPGGTEPKNSDAPAADTPNIGSLGGDNQDHDVSESVIAESLTYGLRNTGWDLAPWKNNGSSGNTIYTQLYATLMANPKFGTALADMQYDMAESYTISDDGLHATVKLKDYIRDSKGNAIGAEDVVFSYETAPNVAGAYANIGVYVDEIKATNDLTVEITVSSAAPGVWEYVLSHCPVVNKAWYEGATDEQRSGDPATTGAYKVKENIPGTSVTLEAVEDFWQKDGDRTVYEVATAKIIKCVGISEDAMRVIALENGELDLAWIENTSIKTFADSGEFELFDFYMTNPTTFVFNCAEGSIFHDNADLRQAVLHAIDFEQVRIAASGDFGFQGHDVAPAVCGDYQSAWNDAPYYDYDLDVAKEYLQKAGYDEKSGLSFHFMCKTMGPQKAAVAVVQSCLRNIGIEVIIDAYDQALFDTYYLEPEQWDMCWHSGNMATGFVTEAWNWYYGTKTARGSVGFVQDETLQSLLNAAMEKNDAESLNAFHDYAVEQAYAVNAFNEQAYLVGRKGIVGVQFNIEGPALNGCIFTEDYVPAK